MSASVIRSRAMVTHAIDRYRWNEITDGAALQEGGRIVEIGTYQELSRKHPNAAVVSSRKLGRYGGINEDFVLVDARRRGKADGAQEPIEGSIEAAIEAIEQRVFVWREACVAEDRVKAGGAQGSVDALALPGSRARQIHRGDPLAPRQSGRSSCRPVG